jgi:hypothetical protein
MATSTHKITATRSGSTEREDWDIEYQITFTFWPTERATLVCPGAEPGVEFVSAIYEFSADPVPEAELEWCADWLENHYDEAVSVAQDDRLADADDHADFLRRQRRDDSITGNW